MWDFLDKASEKGRAFKDKLSQSDGYSRTKLFMDLPSNGKSICMAVAMASGAAGCGQAFAAAEPADGAQLNLQQQLEVIAEHTANIDSRESLRERLHSRKSLHSQARYMLNMAPSELSKVAHQTKAPSATELPAMTVAELASKIAGNDGNVDIGAGVGVVNPYLSDQTVPVHENGSLPFYLKNVLSGDLPASGIVTYMSTDSAFALKAHYDYDSLLDERNQTKIMLPERMSSSSNWMEDAPLEQYIANTLNHEIAHAHFTQTLATYGTTFTDSEIDLTFDRSLMAEAHAVLTADLTTAQQYDVSSDDFRAYIEQAAEMRDEKMLIDMGGHSNYRPQKAYEVIDQMLEANPTLIQDIDPQDIPILAMDIVVQGGFYHNNADLLMSSIGELPEHAEQGGHAQDKQFATTVQGAYPDNSVLAEKTKQLTNLWGDHNGADTLERLASHVDSTLGGGPVPDGQADRFLGLAEKVSDRYEDRQPALASIANQSADAIRSGELTFSEGMQSFAQGLREAASQAPSLDDIDNLRSELLADIQIELGHQRAEEMAADPIASQAIGSGSDADSVAIQLMDRYNLDQFLENNDYQLYAGPSL